MKGVRAVKKIVVQVIVIAISIAVNVLPLLAWGGDPGG